MAQATITTLGVDDLHERLNSSEAAVNIHRDAIKNGMRLGAYLERLNPSEKDDPLDAFGRQMRKLGIIAQSNPDAGYWASPASEFFEGSTAARALYPEFFARQWRKVGDPRQRAIFLNSDGVAGSWQRPYADAMDPRWDQRIAPAIPLSELVAMTTPISGSDYRAFYLTYDATALRQFRLGEAAEIPIAKLADAERTIQLKKFGRGLQASYEQLRRMRVDKLAMYIQFAAIQSEIDKVAAALDVIVNGDGNANTAATNTALNTVDAAAVSGTLTLKGWLGWKMLFAQPYTLTTALMTSAVALQLILLNTGSGNVPLAQLPTIGGIGQGLAPINQTADGVRYGWTSDATAATIIGIDRRFALEYVTEIGGEISETERFITNQTQIMTMTEVTGFAVLDPTAARTLTLTF